MWHCSIFHRATCGDKFPSEVWYSTPKIVCFPAEPHSHNHRPSTPPSTAMPTRERLLQLYKVLNPSPAPFLVCTAFCLKSKRFSSQLSASIFNTTFNPSNIRTGNKILRQRLKGAALAEYYPPRVVTIRDMRRLWPEMKIPDEDEETRVASVERYVFSFFWFGGWGWFRGTDGLCVCVNE